MATYPTFLQIAGSEIKPLDGKVLNRSVSGKPRIRSYYSQTRRDIRIVHDLSLAQLAELNTFFDENKDISFEILYQADATTYTCYFVSISKTRPTGAGYFEVVVEMVEV